MPTAVTCGDFAQFFIQCYLETIKADRESIKAALWHSPASQGVDNLLSPFWADHLFDAFRFFGLFFGGCHALISSMVKFRALASSVTKPS